MWKLGWFGGLGVTQGHQQCHHLIQRIQLLIQLYSILYYFRVMELFVKSCLL